MLENVEIEQCERTTVSAVLVVGLGHQVIDVTIEATGTGIAVENSYGVRLIRPNVTGKGEEEGIAIEDSEATVIKGAIVDHVRDGIYIENGTGHELTRPLVTSSRYGVHLMFPTDVSIVSPNLHNVGARRSRWIEKPSRREVVERDASTSPTGAGARDET
ncbi:NosD domain-containing protein [Exiguobacterium sp. s141]|uniref:NosD domain-containing protein n=1 Tax=Exiguobacterium sp. s141 TaxID=2751240 RepID=UPI001BE5BB08